MADRLEDLRQPATAEVRILHGREEVADFVATLVEDYLVTAVRARGRASVVLAGGSTPRPVYTRLEPFEGIQAVDWLLGDERLVESGSNDSNGRMVTETVLERLSIAADRRHLPDLETPPTQLVDAYRDQVEQVLEEDAEGRFDLVILGLGEDGHTASLFPADADRTAGDVVQRATAPSPPRNRLTLTANALNRTRLALFLAIGESKAEAVRRAALGGIAKDIPASWIRPANGRLLWVLDRGAARALG